MSDYSSARSAETGLVRFVDTAKRFPMLSPDREQALAQAWRTSGDRKALEQLVGAHLRLVLKIARGYRGYGLPLADLVAEGNLGLMQAAHKFEPERGFRFATYALWWIMAAIQEHVLRSWSLVKVGTTGAQKKLFFNLRRLKARIEDAGGTELPAAAVARIAKDLDVPAADVIEMNRRLAGGDHSLDAPVEGGEGDRLALLVDDRPSPEAMVAEADEAAKRRRLLDGALKVLDERERRILFERRLSDEPLTLEALSQQLRVSRERVRQLEVRAFRKLQRAILGALSLPAPA